MSGQLVGSFSTSMLPTRKPDLQAAEVNHCPRWKKEVHAQDPIDGKPVVHSAELHHEVRYRHLADRDTVDGPGENELPTTDAADRLDAITKLVLDS